MVDALVMVRGIAHPNSTIKPAFPWRKSSFFRGPGGHIYTPAP
jgi:hypothetical protein